MESNPKASTKSMVDIRDLHFARGHRKIFQGLHLDVPRGGITAIVGPSGTGKTTLLRLIGGQLKPQSGTIEFDGEPIHALKRTALFEVRKRMSLLFQSGALFTDLNVFENVAFPLREHTQLSASMIRTLVLMKLQAVGLRGAANLMPSQLSGGMARRVALARAIALDPMMIMYDEPFTGQDPISLGALVQLVRFLNDALGLTSIVVSHDIRETLSIADYVYLIAEGHVMEHGPPADLEHHCSAWTRQFLHGEPDGPVPFHYPAAADYAADILGSPSL